MSRYATCLAAVLVCAPYTMTGAAQDDVLPFEITEKTLPNGLRVVVMPTGFPNLVSIQIPVQTGSRNEVEEGKSGFAHFFEHMMFRGTPTFPPAAYQAVLTRAGARSNAYTTDDYTNYYVTFAKEDLEQMLALEADRFQNLAYSEAAFKTEARAVLGEYNKNSAHPLRKLFEVLRDNAFTSHTYKHTTLGFLRDIQAMPEQFDYSKEFFGRWYRPEHTTVIVAGDVDPAEVLPLVEKHWGNWERGSFRANIPAEPAPRGPVYAHVEWKSPTQPWLAVMFHGPAFSTKDKDHAALDLLLELYFGPTSELYRRLVLQDQKVDQLHTSNDGRADSYLFGVLALTKSADDVVAVRDAILKTFVLAREKALASKRVEEAKSSARYGLLRSLEDTDSIAATLAAYVRYERSASTLNEFYRVYRSLTPADLQAAARRWVTDRGLVVTTLASDALPEAVQQPASLTTPASPEGQGPKMKMKMKTKLKLLSIPLRLPQLSIKLSFRAGSAFDPPGKEGLAHLAAAMITEAGSKSRTIDEIQERLFPIAGGFDAQVDREVTTVTLSVHKDNWETFSELTLPMLLEPGFRESDFTRLKDAQLSQLKLDLRSNNEEELGKEQLLANLFAGSRYEHPALGTVAGIEGLTLGDVKDFVQRAFTRGNLTVAVAGNAPAELIEGLVQTLGDLPEGGPLPDPAVRARQPRGLEVEIVQKKTRATAISFGHPIPITRSHPDYPALWLARTWLGEHRSSMSHLYERIREVRGMNYGDYAYIEAFPGGMFQLLPPTGVVRRAQIFEVWIRPVDPKNAHMALRIALYELDKFVREGLAPEDFERTQNYLMKNVFLMTASQDQRAGYALDSDWYGMGEFAATMRARLSKLTLDDVNTAIRKYLSSENLAVVIVTEDAEGLKDALVSDAFSPITYDGEKPMELLTEDKSIGALKLDISADSVQITPVEEVFAGAS